MDFNFILTFFCRKSVPLVLKIEKSVIRFTLELSFYRLGQIYELFPY